MSTATDTAAARGALAAIASSIFWGVLPLYWKQMASVSALELIAQRVVWSLLFLIAVLAWQGAFASLKSALTDARSLVSTLLSGGILAVNWLIFVWAVNAGHVIEASLGYFLAPLFNVAMGFGFLHERLRPPQWAAIAFAAAGVAVLLFSAAHVPWIALSLAGSWSLYGILKKKSALDAIPGLAMETLLLFPIASIFLLWQAGSGHGAFSQPLSWLHVLIMASGVITVIPLLLFAYGAKRLRLATLGLLQYIAPSMQFLLGLLLYHEPFDSVRLHACILIWCGLAIYTLDSFWAQRRRFWAAANAA